ncbi:hypothetical protein NLX83_00450 [Allokutzneria sp. A3M-2-11 16]|uniref:hypothetical protein n=1 Tax=Allokutzneria sp. A3M-2-11 16 TaxID=2962043 RepID=UPI0020B66AC8|nr:hypothetical protein [Allokutzneria sp. A3M-2-11 16]MCP3797718.1 hypothetical protein [Allokutzneria sp. A3M-2-11 16]
MALPSLKSFLAVGALMVAIPLAGAPAALAAAPAESQVTADHPVPGKPGHSKIVIKGIGIGKTENEAVKGAKIGVAKGLAEHEKRTGTKCKPIHESLMLKKDHDKYIAVAELHAFCVKR